MSNPNPNVGASTATNPYPKMIGKPIIRLSPEAFQVRLDHLVKRGVFNNNSPLIGKGLRQHVTRLLQFGSITDNHTYYISLLLLFTL